MADRLVKRKEVQDLGTYKTIFNAKGDNIVAVENAGSYDRGVIDISIELKTPAASQYSFPITVNGIPVCDVTPVVEVGKKSCTNISITRPLWEANEDMTITIPDIGGNIAHVRVLNDWNPTLKLKKPLNEPVASSLVSSGSTSLTYTWTDPNSAPNNESGIEVQHADNAYFDNAVAITLPADTVSTEITGITTAVERWARVRAIGDVTNNTYSRWSNVLSATPGAVTSITELGTNVFYTNTVVDSDSTTQSHTLVAGSNRGIGLLVFGEGTQALANVTATYGGVSMTRNGDIDDYGTAFCVSFYLEEASLPANGANNVVVSHTSYVGSSMSIYVYELGECQFDKATQNSDGSFITLSNTFTPAFAGSYVVSAFTTSSGSATVISEDNGQTQLEEGNQNGNRISVAKKSGIDAVSTTLTSSYSSPAHHLARVVQVWSPKQA